MVACKANDPNSIPSSKSNARTLTKSEQTSSLNLSWEKDTRSHTEFVPTPQSSKDK